MYQRWLHLSFLHWAVAAEEIQRLLPPGLTVDTFDGTAYVGLVPFTMDRIRLSSMPTVPGASSSHETNVRTYVLNERGEPGVWFFSLEAENPVFVAVARAWYHLPYFRAEMFIQTTRAGAYYRSVRRGSDQQRAGCEVRVEFGDEVSTANPGSLEHFLVERYVLFASFRGRLYSGRVWHAPYRIASAVCSLVQENILEVAHITKTGEVSALYSPGVEVEVFGLERL